MARCGGTCLRARSSLCKCSGAPDVRLHWSKGRLPWNAEGPQGVVGLIHRLESLRHLVLRRDCGPRYNSSEIGWLLGRSCRTTSCGSIFRRFTFGNKSISRHNCWAWPVAWLNAVGVLVFGLEDEGED